VVVCLDHLGIRTQAVSNVCFGCHVGYVDSPELGGARGGEDADYKAGALDTAQRSNGTVLLPDNSNLTFQLAYIL
jgi:hypothetical protein